MDDIDTDVESASKKLWLLNDVSSRVSIFCWRLLEKLPTRIYT
jgi:uncharacterized protein HemX